MREAGFIYKGFYDGWYCIHEETFFTGDSGREGTDEEAGLRAHTSAQIAIELERIPGGVLVLAFLPCIPDKLLELMLSNLDLLSQISSKRGPSFVESAPGFHPGTV